MTKEHFVDAIRKVVQDTAVFDSEQLLRHPPGRKPDPKLVRLSRWFKSLPDDQKQNVLEVVALASSAAVFGFLCVLDGVRPIEDQPDKGQLRLAIDKDGSSVMLNDDTGPLLHELLFHDNE